MGQFSNEAIQFPETSKEFSMRIALFRSPRVLAVAVQALLVLGASLTLGQEIPRQGTFSGNWRLEGTTIKVTVDGTETAVYHLEGPVTIRSGSNLPREFQSTCVGASDQTSGGAARCRWTDGEGDVLVVELSSRILGYTGTVRTANGEVAGGTGKYACQCGF